MVNKKFLPFFYKKGGFSLIELLVVIIIIALLSGLAVPFFTKTKRAALDKEAKIVLKLIQAAQKIYALKVGGFYPDNTGPAADLAGLNTNLRLDISPSPPGYWDYHAISTGVGDFTAIATNTANTTTWRIHKTGDSF